MNNYRLPYYHQELIYPNYKMMSSHELIASEMEPVFYPDLKTEKLQRKYRSVEEIAASKLEKEQKQKMREERSLQIKLEKEQKQKIREEKATRNSGKLVPGTGIFAKAAMTILEMCSNEMSHTNLAFRQMIASRIIFPPKKNINKFATGGIAEECISQLFCNVGLVCNNLSEDANVIDLEIQVPIINSSGVNENVPLKVSLKNSGKITSPPILENYRGQKRTEIRPLPPTFIIYTEMDIKRVRIVYLDEEILRQGYPTLSDEEFCAEIYANCDSNLTFKSGLLSKFIPRLPAEYILTSEYPEDIVDLKERNFSKLALAEVERQLGKK